MYIFLIAAMKWVIGVGAYDSIADVENVLNEYGAGAFHIWCL